MRTWTITMDPMFPDLKPGSYLGGCSDTYVVLAITGPNKILVRDLTPWERLGLWLREEIEIEWIIQTARIRRLWRTYFGENQ